MFEILMRVFALINKMKPVVEALEQGTAEIAPHIPEPTQIFGSVLSELNKAKVRRVDMDNWYRIDRHAAVLDDLWERYINARWLSKSRVRQAKAAEYMRMPKPDPQVVRWETRLSCF